MGISRSKYCMRIVPITLPPFAPTDGPCKVHNNRRSLPLTPKALCPIFEAALQAAVLSLLKTAAHARLRYSETGFLTGRNTPSSSKA